MNTYEKDRFASHFALSKAYLIPERASIPREAPSKSGADETNPQEVRSHHYRRRCRHVDCVHSPERGAACAQRGMMISVTW